MGISCRPAMCRRLQRHQKTAGGRTHRKQMGAASRSLISRWSYEQCRSGVTFALNCVIRREACAP